MVTAFETMRTYGTTEIDCLKRLQPAVFEQLQRMVDEGPTSYGAANGGSRELRVIYYGKSSRSSAI